MMDEQIDDKQLKEELNMDETNGVQIKTPNGEVYINLNYIAGIDYVNQWAREVGVAMQVSRLDARGLRSLLRAIRECVEAEKQTLWDVILGLREK